MCRGFLYITHLLMGLIKPLSLIKPIGLTAAWRWSMSREQYLYIYYV